MVYVLPDGATKTTSVQTRDAMLEGELRLPRDCCTHTATVGLSGRPGAGEGDHSSAERETTASAAAESFCDEEHVIPKADFSSCWDELGYSHGSSCCCSRHHRGGGNPDGPEHPSFAKPFISGRELAAAAQVERRMCIASAQGYRHVWALGPLAAVEDFQQVLALGFVQALGLQL